MSDSFKLLAGKIYQSWHDYPQVRKALKKIPKGPPVFVTGTHRSGTTWVSAMLNIPGLWYIHEPFNPDKGLWQEAFSYIPADDNNEKVNNIIEALLQGRLRRLTAMPGMEHGLMPLRLLPQPINRIQVKDPIACLMSEYLTRRFDFQTLVIFRHPCGFVSSLNKLGWACSPVIRQFLSNKALMADWLYPYSLLMEKVCHKESIETYSVLHGCINTILWGYAERNKNMKVLHFEKLCLTPLESFKSIFMELNLPYNNDIRNMHKKLSLSEPVKHCDYKAHAVQRNSAVMAEKWRSELTMSEQNEVRKIWESFDIPLYKDELSW